MRLATSFLQIDINLRTLTDPIARLNSYTNRFTIVVMVNPDSYKIARWAAWTRKTFG